MEDKIISFKGSVAAYTKIEYTSQVTSYNGETDFNMSGNCSF